jgi:hypothetical protein
MESWSGGKSPRNPHYNRALTTLLSRLAHLDAILVDGFVDSRDTRRLRLSEENCCGAAPA